MVEAEKRLGGIKYRHLTQSELNFIWITKLTSLKSSK